MGLASSIGIGFALAVDASITAFSCGILTKKREIAWPLKLAITTGIFQGVMPLIGFLAAESFVKYIANWANLVACAVFVFLGVLCIYGAVSRVPEEVNMCVEKIFALRNWKGIFAIGIATSIDALAVGIGIAFADAVETAAGNELPHSEIIYVPAAIFALITFCSVMAAFFSSNFFKKLPSKFLGILAGLILIALGIHAGFFDN